jgi:hypothetical protein
MTIPGSALPACISGLLLAASVSRVTAAEAGAWETMSTLANSDAWTVYDYADDGYYFPDWAGDVAGEEYSFFFHTGDDPLWFFADTLGNPGNGKLLGNYAVEKVQAILADVLIASLPDFSDVECVVFASGPAGRTHYFSPSYYNVDFATEGWYSLRFPFDEPWFFFNGTGFQAVPVTAGLLATIEEIGFRFWPKEGVVRDVAAAIDNVKLEPLVESPALAVSATGNEFRLAFTPPKATSCLIEKQTPAPPFTWEKVVGQTSITGTTEHLFTTPLSGRGGIFRVQSAANYTPFVTPAP